MAEAILRAKQIDSIEVRSAGIFAMEGGEASHHTQAVLDEMGIPHNHRSHSVTQADVHWADYVFAMTAAHKAMLMEQFPFAMDRIFTVKEFATGMGLNVSDPFGGSIEMYRETFQELNALMEPLIANLDRQTQGS
ncbi:protein tyrosine phosphatase [Jeotgalibacillus soli]|uniref:Protein tyrosine phosphatase n=2 Tax=Jeotgalibacillus soli TaxID=889306 RepID=A0A0C2W0P2_9BACL|nr:protein tyrosine phosphatase [Jeotgalibacillus soli]